LRQYANRYTGAEVCSASEFSRSLGIAYRGFIFGGFYHLVDKFLQDPCKFGRETLTAFDFLSKLTLTSTCVEDQMIAEYRATEARLREWHYDPALLLDLRAIANELLADFETVEGLMPHHGPGATLELERRQASDVYKGFRPIVDSHTLDLLVQFGLNPADFIVGQRSVHQCQIVFVPKGMTSKRVISKEETSMQMVQQAVKDALYAYLSQSDWWRMILTIEDQNPSRDLAQLGSIDASYDTLDLSAASDSNSVTLVANLFSGIEPLCGVLLATRSTEAILDGEVVPLSKFAPMGSATCFAVESIVFSVILEKARRDTHSRRLFRVFGDDLVVPREYTERAVEILTAMGFVVNERKSFVGGGSTPFREACGVEAIKGFDVSPLRLSRQYRVDYTSPGRPRRMPASSIAQALGFINRCWETGWLGPRSFELRSLQLELDLSGFTRGPGCDIEDSWSNLDQLPRRYNRHEQRVEIAHHTLVPDGRAARVAIRRISDERLYQLWLYTNRGTGRRPDLPEAALSWFLKTGDHRLQLRPERPAATSVIRVGTLLARVYRSSLA
jgi:hypothetical protein